MSTEVFRQRVLEAAYSWSLPADIVKFKSSSGWIEIAHTPQFFSAGVVRVFHAAMHMASKQPQSNVVCFLNDYLPANSLSSSRVFQMQADGRPIKTPLSLISSSKDKDKAMKCIPSPSEDKINHTLSVVQSILRKESKTQVRKFGLGWEERMNQEWEHWVASSKSCSTLAEWFGSILKYHLGVLSAPSNLPLTVVPSSKFAQIFKEPLEALYENHPHNMPPPGWIVREGKRRRPTDWKEVLLPEWCPDVYLRQSLANHLSFQFRFNGRVKPYQVDCDEKSQIFFNISPPKRISVSGSTEIYPALFGLGSEAIPPFSLVYWIFGKAPITKILTQSAQTEKAIICHENH
jgi:hypothetical protein